MNTLNELNSLHNSKFAKNEAFLFLSFYIDFLIGRRLSKKKRHFRLWLKNRFNPLGKKDFITLMDHLLQEAGQEKTAV